MDSSTPRASTRLWLLGWLVPATLAVLVLPLIYLTVLVALTATPVAALVPGFFVIRYLDLARLARPRDRDAGPEDADAPAERVLPGTAPDLERLVADAAGDVGLAEIVEIELTQGAVIVAEPRTRDVIRLSLGVAHIALLDPESLAALVKRELVGMRTDRLCGRRARRTIGTLDVFVATLRSGEPVIGRPAIACGQWSLDQAVAVARKAQLDVDAQAAKLVGADVLARAMLLEAVVASLGSRYWLEEVQHALSAGFRPPFVAGLRAFAPDRLAARPPEELVAESLDLAGGSLLASSTSERLALIQHGRLVIPDPLLDNDESVVDDMWLEGTAARLLERTAAAASLSVTAADWPEALAAVIESDLVDRVDRHRDWLSSFELADVPATLAALRASGPDATGDDGQLGDDRATALVARLTLTLIADGWQIECAPGAPFSLRRGDAEVLPFALGGALERREASGADFDAWCRDSGLGRLIDVDEVVDRRDAPARTPVPAALLAAAAAPVDAASLPPGEALTATTVRLWSPRSPRIIGYFFVALSALVAIPVIVLCLSRGLSLEAGHSISQRAPYTAFALGTAVFLVWVIRTVHNNPAWRPSVSVDATGTLTIQHAGLLRGPLTIPREALLAADVDSSETGQRFAVVETRGPLKPGGRQVRAFLWDRVSGPLLPLLDIRPGRPNVAIVLREAVSSPRAVRNSGLKAPLAGGSIDALLLRSSDPDAARELFSALGVLRTLTVADFEQREQHRAAA